MACIQNTDNITTTSYDTFISLNDEQQEETFMKILQSYVSKYSNYKDNDTMSDEYKKDTSFLFRIIQNIMIGDSIDELNRDEETKIMNFHLNKVIDYMNLDDNVEFNSDIKVSLNYILEIFSKANEDEKSINESLTNMGDTIDTTINTLAALSKVNELKKLIPLKESEFKNIITNFDGTNHTELYITNTTSHIKSLKIWFETQRTEMCELAEKLGINVPEKVLQILPEIENVDINGLDYKMKNELTKKIMTQNILNKVYFIDMVLDNIKLFMDLLDKIHAQ